MEENYQRALALSEQSNDAASNEAIDMEVVTVWKNRKGVRLGNLFFMY